MSDVEFYEMLDVRVGLLYNAEESLCLADGENRMVVRTTQSNGWPLAFEVYDIKGKFIAGSSN